MSALRGRVAALEAELAEARRAVLMLEENGRHEAERIAAAVRAEAERAAGAVALLRRVNALELDNWPLAKRGFVDARDELTAEVSGWLKDHDAAKQPVPPKTSPDDGPMVENLPTNAQPDNPRLYKDRNCAHCYMGPPQDYPCCGGRGRGWADDGERNRYCDCRAGAERKRTDRSA